MVKNNLHRFPPAKFRRGDAVSFAWGNSRVNAEVAELRGPLGVGGAQVYRLIATLPSEDEPVSFELSEDRLELVQPLETAQR